MISVKYKCKAESNNVTLIILSGPLLNIEKKGDLNGEFSISKHLLIAHLFSVVLYALLLTGFLLFLGLFAVDEKVFKFIFYSISIVSAIVGVFVVSKSIFRYKRTIRFLREHYDNYVY